MGWDGSCYFQAESWVFFFTPLFLQRCVQCMTPLTRFSVDTQNLATSHLSIWKTYQKILHSLQHVLPRTNDQLDFLISARKGQADSSEIGLLD